MVVLLFAMLVCVAGGGLEVRYSKDTRHHTRLITNYDLGLQHIELPGVLHVDGVDSVVTVLTFLKTSRASNGSLVCKCAYVACVDVAKYLLPTSALCMGPASGVAWARNCV